MTNAPTPTDRELLAIRELLICPDAITFDDILADANSLPCDDAPLTRSDLLAMRSDLHELDRTATTLLLLDHSLCPLHCCDYAICFDDDDPECAAIRLILPDHDT